MSEESSTPKPLNINIDLGKAAEASRVGVRRASAFLRLSQELAALEIPDDISLDVGTRYQFWHSPLQPDTKEQIREAFNSWIVGSCFKELESHFATFLDEVWRILEWSTYHGTTLPAGSHIQLDTKFSRVTNIASKAERILARMEIEESVTELNSISRTRNALTHGLGRVRSEDAQDDGKLEVSWRAFDIFLISNGQETLLSNEPFEPLTVTDESGAQVFIRSVIRKRQFDVGQRIELSRRDLAEICLFFTFQTDQLVQHLGTYLTKKFAGDDPVLTG